MGKKRNTKYIFVTGGVLSGVGKGITAASLGALLKARGFLVTIQKCDQYLNVDAGTLNPAEHGEVFVTDDGAETDLDLGHYERFLDIDLTGSSSLMTGRVLKSIIEAERSGKYLGKTVQVVPHVTRFIQDEIIRCGQNSDVHIVEVGGTVGDIEGLHFIEAIRELGLKVGRQNVLYAHVVYIPFLGASKEFKTKPAQHAVLELRSLGIVPELLVARSENIAPSKIIEKLSLFGGVPVDGIALLPNAKTVYEVPLTLEREGIVQYVCDRLGLESSSVDLKQWEWVKDRATKTFKKTVKIAIVAKYLDNEDTYLSVTEALKSAAWKHAVNVQMEWISAEKINSRNVKDTLRKFDGVVVPGGFGNRGVEGKIATAIWCLQNKKPYLGLCLGLQVAVIAGARLSGLKEANSTEINPKTKHPVINTMDGQLEVIGTGGTMRLGSYPCKIKYNSLAHKIYNSELIRERHRHRFEVNNDYLKSIEKGGITVSGVSPNGNLVEIIEAKNHPFFIASQFHPEYKSRPFRPHPLFDHFISVLKKKTK